MDSWPLVRTAPGQRGSARVPMFPGPWYTRHSGTLSQLVPKQKTKTKTGSRRTRGKCFWHENRRGRPGGGRVSVRSPVKPNTAAPVRQDVPRFCDGVLEFLLFSPVFLRFLGFRTVLGSVLPSTAPVCKNITDLLRSCKSKRRSQARRRTTISVKIGIGVP